MIPMSAVPNPYVTALSFEQAAGEQQQEAPVAAPLSLGGRMVRAASFGRLALTITLALTLTLTLTSFGRR